MIVAVFLKLFIFGVPSYIWHYASPLTFSSARFWILAGLVLYFYLSTRPIRKADKYWEHLGFESELKMFSLGLFGAAGVFLAGNTASVVMGILIAICVAIYVVKNCAEITKAKDYSPTTFWIVVFTCMFIFAIPLYALSPQRVSGWVAVALPHMLISGAFIIFLMQWHLQTNVREMRRDSEAMTRNYLRDQGVAGNRKNVLELWEKGGAAYERRAHEISICATKFNGRYDEDLSQAEQDWMNKHVTLMMNAKPASIFTTIVGVIAFIVTMLVYFPIFAVTLMPLVAGVFICTARYGPVSKAVGNINAEHIRGLYKKGM